MHKELAPELAGLNEHDLFLATLWGEARGEPLEGQVAVAQVIQNRVNDSRWGGTVHSVLGAWAQFSCLWADLGGANYQDVLRIAGVLDDCWVGLPEESAEERLLEQLDWVVTGVRTKCLLDLVHGATHYYATWIDRPSWAEPPAVRTATYGRHEFYRGVA